jgi:hypothetical protein
VASHPTRLGAQRFTCEEASTVLLSTDAQRLDRFAATNALFRCGDITAGTVASALRRAKPNTTADTLATILAWVTFDRRLVDSIRVVAVDSSQSTARRTLYLQLLTNYAVPFTVVDTEAIKRATYFVLRRRQPLHGNRKHLLEAASAPFGTRLIRKEDRARAVATIAEMARHDPDENLRLLAGRVVTELEQLIAESDANDLFPRRWP